ncbi:arginase [Exiguobacterium flavidum]|uniref:arginase n=1 Tax=Exiguobacterium flavidum TaxID=2184695 RepID=UPI000DF7E780|nr:arginase [Exiguobacterium flavidum]
MNIAYISVPYWYGQGKRGTDLGPKAVEEAGLFETFERYGESIERFGEAAVLPERAVWEEDTSLKRLEGVLHTTNDLHHLVRDAVDQGKFPLLVGGDHSMAIGTIAGLKQATPRLGVIWFDAHADLNTPDSSPSGNIHGMPLAVAIGEGEERLVSVGGAGAKLLPEQIVYIGLRDVDPGEQQLIEERGIRVYGMNDIRERGMEAIMEEAVRYLEEVADHFYLSFDLDGLDPSIVQGIGTPVADGISLEDAQVVLKHCADHARFIAAEFVEVNPLLEEGNGTAIVTNGLIDNLLEYMQSHRLVK